MALQGKLLQRHSVGIKSDDTKEVTSLFDKYLGIKTSISNAVRIGKKGNKPRLLKVTVNNLEDKINILHNKLKLRNKGNPESIKSIFITADLTPLEQQQQHKQLREQLKELNKYSNNYYIKNRAIVQRKKQ